MEMIMVRKALVASLFLAAATTTASAQSVSGTVKKVDMSAGKITIIHGPIKNLQMDSMTMVFRVKDPEMLKQVKAGNKIRFDADRVNGALTVIRMKKQ